jgi:hypothetical protein
MKKVLGRLVLLGALAGAVYAALNYLREESAATEAIQMVFDDGSTRSLTSSTTEGKEFIDIACKIVEIGL